MGNWQEWLKAALVRAVKTFAQTFASMIAVGAAASEVDWLRALSVSGVAFVLSVLTSLGGLPEVKNNEVNNRSEKPKDPLAEEREIEE